LGIPKKGKGTVLMKKEKFSCCFAVLIFAFLFIAGCATTSELAGSWKEIGKTATIELSKDGTFNAVDNQKMAVSGKYYSNENGNIRFEIPRQGYFSEIINGKYSLEGDILILTSEDGKEIQRYRRQK
jgi:hypothetical protein